MMGRIAIINIYCGKNNATASHNILLVRVEKNKKILSQWENAAVAQTTDPMFNIFYWGVSRRGRLNEVYFSSKNVFTPTQKGKNKTKTKKRLNLRNTCVSIHFSFSPAPSDKVQNIATQSVYRVYTSKNLLLFPLFLQENISVLVVCSYLYHFFFLFCFRCSSGYFRFQSILFFELKKEQKKLWTRTPIVIIRYE